MTNPKILILGHGRHGKDTVAELLTELFGLKMLSSSLFAAEMVMMPYFAEQGIHYCSVEDCYADRHTGNNRAVWYNQIKEYNTPDKASLARQILNEADMYVGMRSKEEFDAARELFDFVVWVDASERGIPAESQSSMTIEYDPKEMLLVKNNGSKRDLFEKVEMLGEMLGLAFEAA